jgi:hypothetical protein
VTAPLSGATGQDAGGADNPASGDPTTGGQTGTSNPGDPNTPNNPNPTDPKPNSADPQTTDKAGYDDPQFSQRQLNAFLAAQRRGQDDEVTSKVTAAREEGVAEGRRQALADTTNFEEQYTTEKAAREAAEAKLTELTTQLGEYQKTERERISTEIEGWDELLKEKAKKLPADDLAALKAFYDENKDVAERLGVAAQAPGVPQGPKPAGGNGPDAQLQDSAKKDAETTGRFSGI